MNYKVTLFDGPNMKILYLNSADVRTLGEMQVAIMINLVKSINEVFYIIHSQGIIGGANLPFSASILQIGLNPVLTLFPNSLGIMSLYKGHIKDFVDYLILTIMLGSMEPNRAFTQNIQFDASFLLREYLKEIHNQQRERELNNTDLEIRRINIRQWQEAERSQSNTVRHVRNLQRNIMDILNRPASDEESRYDNVEREYSFVFNLDTNEIAPTGSTPITHLDVDDNPYLVALNELGESMSSSLTPQNSFEDVAITISEEDFDNFTQLVTTNGHSKCSICLGDLSSNLRQLKICNHVFHYNCIKTQLVHFNCRCPTCRADVRQTLTNFET